MKKGLLVLFLCSVFLCFSGVAGATSFEFEDVVDFHGGFFDAATITSSSPLRYTHDITDDVDLPAGETVTNATLELNFAGDLIDGTILFWDFNEYCKIAYDGSGWIEIGEVDQSYDLVLDISWLNDDGKLDVTVAVTNYQGTAYLDYSKLTGTAETAPVPEPATMLLLGAGLFGLAAISRKRNAKKNK